MDNIMREKSLHPHEEKGCEEKYSELLMAVGNKYEGETRHETALRYLRRAEQGNSTASKTTPNLNRII